MEQNRTKINKERLLKALESSLGVITTALKATDLSRTNFYKWLKEDEEFKAQVEEIVVQDSTEKSPQQRRVKTVVDGL